MKPLLFRNPKTEKESLLVQEDRLPHFYDKLHYHPEVQLTFIEEGSGTRFVGDGIDRFYAGDVTVYGSNLPHVLHADPAFYEDGAEQWCEGTSLYFRPESFGPAFMKLPELKTIHDFMERSSRGVSFQGDSRRRFGGRIKRIAKLQGFKRLHALLDLLYEMAQSEEYSYLSRLSFAHERKDTDHRKINDVFEYVMQHFNEDIRLQQIADVAHMSETAFCRYFKQRTRMTFSRFLNEVRVGHACRLLMEGGLQVTEICYRCGFNNVSNFNRQFKLITGYTPSTYKRMHELPGAVR